MDSLNQSGIFYFSSGGAAAATQTAFPDDCRRTFKSSIDPRFILIFAIIFVVLGGTVAFLASLKPNETVSEKDIAKLQERYAKMVLNKEMPNAEEEAKKKAAAEAARRAAEAAAEAAAAAEESQEKEAEAEVKRQTETVQEKVARKQASTEQRAAKRDVMKKQIENVGLFAELTAAGPGGGGGGSSKSGVKDLIGNIDAGSSLSDVSISGASFATKNANAYEGGGPGGGGGLAARRGERSEGGSIGTSGLATASGNTLKSEGSIDVSNVENVEGEAANEASRDMKTLQQVLQKYQPRLKKVYEDFLKRNPDLAGKFVVKFTIEADGSVSNVTVVSSDFKDKDLERNLIRYIERIKFPSASGKVTIEWPLIFSAS